MRQIHQAGADDLSQNPLILSLQPGVNCLSRNPLISILQLAAQIPAHPLVTSHDLYPDHLTVDLYPNQKQHLQNTEPVVPVIQPVRQEIGGCLP